ncbi:MAG: hypothetical protein ACRD3Q_18785, partial [Terriglobales bacterium]
MPAKNTSVDKKNEFASAFQGLRQVLKPYDKKVRVTKDAPGNYMSESKTLRYMGKPVMFAAVMTKSYVSFHFFPVYMFPKLLDGISPELKKRMQGSKTCWNFNKAEPELFAELGTVVEAGLRRFGEMGERDLTREDAKAFWEPSASNSG